MGFILVVDDDKNLAEVTARVLGKEGHEVTVHSETETAFQSLQHRRPDLIILDVMFPENSSGGFELARRISREFGPLPILMFTAVNACFQLHFSARDIDQEWLPAVDFMEKPVDFELLRTTVDRILKGNHPENEG